MAKGKSKEQIAFHTSMENPYEYEKPFSFLSRIKGKLKPIKWFPLILTLVILVSSAVSYSVITQSIQEKAISPGCTEEEHDLTGKCES